MKKLLVAIFLLSLFFANAQYYEAELLMINGSVKKGFAKLPSNKMMDKKIKFKRSKTGSVYKLKEDNISRIIFTSNKGIKFLFERTNVVDLHKSFGKEHTYKRKRKSWILLVHKNPSIKAFYMSNTYVIDKDGVMISKNNHAAFNGVINFLVQKPLETEAYIVSSTGFPSSMTRKSMAIYFKDYPEFLKRINNKEFRGAEIEKIAEEFHKSLQK